MLCHVINPMQYTILTGFICTFLCPSVCCVAVRNCLECRQRQRDRSCKSSLTSSKSQDSLHSASTTSKVPHTHTHIHQMHILHTTLKIWYGNMHMYDAPHLTFCLPYLAGSRQTPAGCRHQSSSSCGFQRCCKYLFVCIFSVYSMHMGTSAKSVVLTE